MTDDEQRPIRTQIGSDLGSHVGIEIRDHEDGTRLIINERWTTKVDRTLIHSTGRIITSLTKPPRPPEKHLRLRTACVDGTQIDIHVTEIARDGETRSQIEVSERKIGYDDWQEQYTSDLRLSVNGVRQKFEDAVADLIRTDAEPTDDESGEESGLYGKYEVWEDGEPVTDCFVLEPEDDPAAREAIIRYAEETDDEELAEDLRDWIADSCTRDDEEVETA